MKNSITASEAKKLLHKYVSTPHILLHSRESEVVMRALARHFSQDEELWGCAGLLHDLDMDIIKGNYKLHGEKTCEILRSEGYQLPEIFAAILSHTECLEEMKQKYRRQTLLDFCLTAGEQITGLITAYARMRPNKFAGIKPKSLSKKFRDRSFAANVNRQMIEDITTQGIERSVFFSLATEALAAIADEIDL